MNKSIKDILQEMTSISTDVGDLVNSLIAADEQDEVQRLRAKVVELQSKINSLLIEVESHKDTHLDLSEDGKDKFIDEFRSNLKDLAFPIIATVYNDAWLSELQQPIKTLAAKVLCSYFESNNKEPLQYWKDVLSGGV